MEKAAFEAFFRGPVRGSSVRPLQETNVVGWQRYSVSFGAGRMGLEFEYDAHETRAPASNSTILVGV